MELTRLVWGTIYIAPACAEISRREGIEVYGGQNLKGLKGQIGRLAIIMEITWKNAKFLRWRSEALRLVK